MTDIHESLNQSLMNNLSFLKNSLGFNQVEIDNIKTPISINFYENWLANNFQGTMSYLKNHFPLKNDPLLIEPSLKSVISISQSYFPENTPSNHKIPGRIALYARNEDYHFWLKNKLLEIIKLLKKDFPGETFLPYVDSGPILERDMAYQNGLGWFGKNTCLIHPDHGSLFFIAEILTTIDLGTLQSPIQPLPDFCGTCQKCIEVCPTGAIIAPRTLKADQCISYLTIESKEAPPLELRKKIGDWFFGCDLCQTICPWNQKIFRKKNIETTDKISTETLLNLNLSERAELIIYFQFLLSSSNKKIQKYHFGSPLSRAGAKGLKRNALIVIANKNLIELKDEVKKIDSGDLLELAQWTLQQLC